MTSPRPLDFPAPARSAPAGAATLTERARQREAAKLQNRIRWAAAQGQATVERLQELRDRLAELQATP